jgi:hypothetical protein
VGTTCVVIAYLLLIVRGGLTTCLDASERHYSELSGTPSKW